MTARYRYALAGVGMVAAMCVAAPAAVAGQPPRLGLTPIGQPEAYFDLTLAPGALHHAEVEAANFGDNQSVARTYAADVYSIVNGGFGAELFGEAPGGTTGWLSYSPLQLTLEPGQAVRLPFVVSVPPGTPPGDYITALVIESTLSVEDTGPLTLNQVTRSAIAVKIDVPGAREPALAIGSVDHRTVAGHSILAFDVTNPGNVHLRPAGRFELLDASGSPVDGGAVLMDSVYAGDRTALEAPLRNPLPPGDYCAALSLTDSLTGARAQTDCLALSVQRPPTHASDDSGPRSLPATSVPMAAVPISLLLLAGGLSLIASLALTRRRRGRGI